VLLNLCAARAGGFKVFLRIPFDLRTTMLAALDLVAEILETDG